MSIFWWNSTFDITAVLLTLRRQLYQWTKRQFERYGFVRKYCYFCRNSKQTLKLTIWILVTKNWGCLRVWRLRGLKGQEGRLWLTRAALKTTKIQIFSLREEKYSSVWRQKQWYTFWLKRTFTWDNFTILLFILKPDYFKKHNLLSSFLLTLKGNNTGLKWQWSTQKASFMF